MKRIRPFYLAPLIAALFFFFTVIRPGSAQTPIVFGTLDNFDVFNDSGQETHGFEIELDGITSKDIEATFGSPYERYGDPQLIDFPGGVFVRYQSAYDAVSQVFAAATPVPPSITPTAGHACWTGGAPGYLGSGCEHFGMTLFRNPTASQYHWLVADPATPGAVKPFTAGVNIVLPLWSVVPGPLPGAAPVVQADLPPPPAPPAQFGTAVWVKILETESSANAELNHLVTDDPAVPQGASQVETEWQISQTNPKHPERAALHSGKPLGKGNQSVVRRYEFYKYTGFYDPSTHEALCNGAECTTPGAGDLGDYIGAQMAAVNVGPAPNVAITGIVNSASFDGAIESGSWVSIFGTGLSSTTRSWRDSDFSGNNLPPSLDGVTITINGKTAAVSYVSPGQLNVQAPSDTAVGPVQAQVTNLFGSATGTVTLQALAPRFFAFSAKYVAAVHTDSALVAPTSYFGAVQASRPAKPGEILLLFGMGFGPTTPAVASGQFVSSAAPLTDPSQLHIRVGGVPAEVRFAGIVAAGEYQFNVVIPALPDGDQPIVADIGGVSTQSGLLITVQN
jgi:uncharacterized protein (TIGR03437 family)